MINYTREGVRAYVKSFERAPIEYLSVPKWIRRFASVQGCGASSTDEMIALKMSSEGCYLIRAREVLLLTEEQRAALATTTSLIIPRPRQVHPGAKITAGEIQEKVVKSLERAAALLEILHSRLTLSPMSAFFLPPELCTKSSLLLRAVAPNWHSEATSMSGATTMPSPDLDPARNSVPQVVMVSRALVEDWDGDEDAAGMKGLGPVEREKSREAQEPVTMLVTHMPLLEDAITAKKSGSARVARALSETPSLHSIYGDATSMAVQRDESSSSIMDQGSLSREALQPIELALAPAHETAPAPATQPACHPPAPVPSQMQQAAPAVTSASAGEGPSPRTAPAVPSYHHHRHQPANPTTTQTDTQMHTQRAAAHPVSAHTKPAVARVAGFDQLNGPIFACSSLPRAAAAAALLRPAAAPPRTSPGDASGGEPGVQRERERKAPRRRSVKPTLRDRVFGCVCMPVGRPSASLLAALDDSESDSSEGHAPAAKTGRVCYTF